MNFAKFCSAFVAVSVLFSVNAGSVFADGLFVKKHHATKVNSAVKTPFAGTWQIKSIKGKLSIIGIRGTLPQIEFVEDGVNGQSGCNGFGGAVQVKGTKMRFGLMRSTQMACPELIMKQEQTLYQALSDVRSYRYDNSGHNAKIHGNMATVHEIQLLDARKRPVLILIRK